MTTVKPMEILVMNRKDDKFEWCKVNYSTKSRIENLYENNYYTEDGDCYTQKDIYDIKNDIRKNYGYCRYCYGLVRRGKEAEHGQKMIAKRPACHKCDWCRLDYTQNISNKIEKNKDGTYTQTNKIKGILRCKGTSYEYSSQKISLERAMAEDGLCKYNQCSKTNAIIKLSKEIPTIAHPDLFKKIATVNKLNTSPKWKFYSRNDERIRYTLGATNLMAVCDEYGIIISFVYSKRNSRPVSFRYSAVTDKFYCLRGAAYAETGLFELPDSKRERWMNEIRVLYEV